MMIDPNKKLSPNSTRVVLTFTIGGPTGAWTQDIRIISTTI